MNKLFFYIILSLLSIGISSSMAQDILKDTSSKLQISGSADLYYKYDFAQSDTNTKAGTLPNADYPYNVFGNKLNTLDFSLLNLRLKKRTGKLTFFSDLAFGPRTDTKSNNPQNSFKIQNLYLTYELTKALAVSAGAMYKFQSFERITPADNFNYSMSKSYQLTFANSFQRAGGLKFNYSFSDKINWSVGIYNSVDAKAADDGISALAGYWVSDFCTQLYVNAIKNVELSAAFWSEGQKANGTHSNLQARYKLSPTIKLGFDGTIYKAKDSELGTAGTSFNSMVLYGQKTVGNVFSVGARYEYQERVERNIATQAYTNGFYNVYTLTGNEKLGALTLKQEIVHENTNKGNPNSLYHDKNGNPSFGSTQIILAAVFLF